MDGTVNASNRMSQQMIFCIRVAILVVTIGCNYMYSFAQQKRTPQPYKGIVMDLTNDALLPYTIVQNLRSGEKVECDNQGRFELMAQVDDLLRFYHAGYRTDTILVIGFELKRVYLTPTGETIRLEQIEVVAMTDQQLDKEILRLQEESKVIDISQTRGGIRLSPSRAFGEDGKKARERLALLKNEKDKRLVDRRFSKAAIQKLTPLDGSDLDRFMLKHRPDVEFVRKASEQDFQLYIMDAYAEFKRERKQ